MNQEFIDDTMNQVPNEPQNKIRFYLVIMKKLKKFRWLLSLIYLLYVVVLALIMVFVLVTAQGSSSIGAGYFAMTLLGLMVADFFPGTFMLYQLIDAMPPNFLLFFFQRGYSMFFFAIILNFIVFYLIGLLIDKRKTIIERMKKISLVGYVVILGVILFIGGLFFYNYYKSTSTGWMIEENPNNQLSEPKLLMDRQIVSKKLSEIPLKYIYLERPDGIRYPELYFSPDGTQFAYEATIADFGGVTENGLVINNEILQGLTVDSFSFSPDSKHYAYTAYDQKVNSGRVVVIDDKRQSYLLPSSVSDGVIFSPDSKHYVYEIEMPGYNSAMLIDNHVGPKYSYVSSFAFSPDSRHYLYVGNNVDQQTGAQNSYLIIDGKITKDVEPGSWMNLKFSPDSQTITYIFDQANGLSIFINGQQDKKSYDQVGSL